MKRKSGFAFIVDTDSYAGNFERAMTAYMTGQIGDCGVGKDFIEPIPMDFSKIIQQLKDEHGKARPTRLWHSPASQCNSVAIFFKKRPSDEEVAFLKSRALLFDAKYEEIEMLHYGDYGHVHKPVSVLGFRMLEWVQGKINEEEL